MKNEKTRGNKKSIIATITVIALLVSFAGTSIASAYDHHPYGGDNFSIVGVVVGTFANYSWSGGYNHGAFRSTAQKGNSKKVRSRDMAAGTAIAYAENFKGGTNRGWFYNYPGTWQGRLGEKLNAPKQ